MVCSLAADAEESEERAPARPANHKCNILRVADRDPVARFARTLRPVHKRVQSVQPLGSARSLEAYFRCAGGKIARQFVLDRWHECESASRGQRRKGGEESGHWHQPWWADHENPCGRRWQGSTTELHRHWWTGPRPPGRRRRLEYASIAARRDRRQGLRQSNSASADQRRSGSADHPESSQRDQTGLLSEAREGPHGLIDASPAKQTGHVPPLTQGRFHLSLR